MSIISFDYSLASYFIFWYLGNYYYNIFNKETLNTIETQDPNANIVITIATLQLGIGVLYSIFLWTVPDSRVFPKITLNDVYVMLPSGTFSALAHILSVVSLSLGGVAFVQIVKASEPVFSALIGMLFYGKSVSNHRWICLFIIVIGVCVSSIKTDTKGHIEMDFNVYSMYTAVLSNIFASFKGAESKKIMDMSDGIMTRLGNVSNQYSIMNIISFTVSLPIIFVAEGSQLNILKNHLKNNHIFIMLIASGFTFYVYNELSTMVLKRVSALTQSVANTAKRVIIIIGSSIVFNENMSGLKAVGCTMCIIGVFMDSIIDDIVKNNSNIAKKKI